MDYYNINLIIQLNTLFSVDDTMLFAALIKSKTKQEEPGNPNEKNLGPLYLTIALVISYKDANIQIFINCQNLELPYQMKKVLDELFYRIMQGIL